MVAINRVRVAWTNWPGAPGLSTFYLASGTTNTAPLKTFFTAIKDLFPLNLTTDVPSSGDVIDSGTGLITGGWAGSGGGQSISAASSGGYAGGSGALIRWQTNAVLNGRRLVGRTYLVPLERGVYFTDGSLTTSAQGVISAAGQAMITAYAGALLVYGPPRDSGTNGPNDPGKAAINSPIISCLVPDLAAVMRSRRI